MTIQQSESLPCNSFLNTCCSTLLNPSFSIDKIGKITVSANRENLRCCVEQMNIEGCSFNHIRVVGNIPVIINVPLLNQPGSVCCSDIIPVDQIICLTPSSILNPCPRLESVEITPGIANETTLCPIGNKLVTVPLIIEFPNCTGPSPAEGCQSNISSGPIPISAIMSFEPLIICDGLISLQSQISSCTLNNSQLTVTFNVSLGPGCSSFIYTADAFSSITCVNIEGCSDSGPLDLATLGIPGLTGVLSTGMLVLGSGTTNTGERREFTLVLGQLLGIGNTYIFSLSDPGLGITFNTPIPPIALAGTINFSCCTI